MSEEGLSKRNCAKTLFNICPFLNRDLTFSQLKSVRGSHAVITKQMLQFPSAAATKVTWIRASLIHEIKDKTCIDVSISGMGKRRKIKSPPWVAQPVGSFISGKHLQVFISLRRTMFYAVNAAKRKGSLR